jgi:D-alanine-D-alanine ligase
VNITVLTYVDEEGSKEVDVVVPQVARALRAGGHKVSIMGVHGDVKRLVTGLQKRKPDLVFNLLEMFGQDVLADVKVTGLMDLMGIRYTGSGPGELFLRQDKALAKKLLAYEGILYPKFAVFSRNADLETGGNLRMPLFVKPLRMDSSIGIGKKSLVSDAGTLMKRVVAIHDQCHDSALAEEYVEGREFYIGVLGNHEPVSLPAIEMDFSGLPAGSPRVAGEAAKWEEGSVEYEGTRSIIAQIPDELRAKLNRVALDACRALRTRDYSRVDLRVTDTGDIYVLEVNANCYLEKSSEFVTAARAAGFTYDQLIEKIVDLAVKRYERTGTGPRLDAGEEDPAPRSASAKE